MKSISGKRLANILKGKGWILVDVNGSHLKYYKDSKSVVIPIHGNKDLKICKIRSVIYLF